METFTYSRQGIKSIDLNYISTNTTLSGATLTEASKYTEAQNNKELVADIEFTLKREVA